jgi:hypothetical protein
MGRPVVGQVALDDRLDLLQLRLGLGIFPPGGGELLLQLTGRSHQVVAALSRGLGKSRIGEMRGVVDTAAFLFRKDLIAKFVGNPLEVGNHHFDLGHLSAFLLDMKTLQSNDAFP